MNTCSQHIGKEMSYNENAFTHSLHAWNKHLKPAILALKQTYEMLTIGAFTQAVFDDLLMYDGTGIGNAQTAYTNALNADVSGLKQATFALKNELMKWVPDTIVDLRNKRDAVISAYQAALNYSNGDTIYMTWESFKIVDGEPVIDVTRLMKRARSV